MTNSQWYSGIVLKGTQHGRTIGFPTANLDPTIISDDLPEGIYSCVVQHGSHQYAGTLFYGPRLVLHETHRVLEVHILDFDAQIYGEEISFKFIKYIRGVENFSSMEALKEALQNDVSIAKRQFAELST